MALKKTKKRSKFSRERGTGTHGGGARKKRKKSGHHGGSGMSGSGKRADHKKTLVIKLFGHKYFGKQGITSKKTEKDKRNRINLEDIQLNIDSYLKKEIAKKTSKGIEINLSSYKILGKGNINEKFIIKAKKASKSAIDKVKKVGGEIILSTKKEETKEKPAEEIKEAEK